jgi:hypothetical protein
VRAPASAKHRTAAQNGAAIHPTQSRTTTPDRNLIPPKFNLNLRALGGGEKGRKGLTTTCTGQAAHVGRVTMEAWSPTVPDQRWLSCGFFQGWATEPGPSGDVPLVRESSHMGLLARLCISRCLGGRGREIMVLRACAQDTRCHALTSAPMSRVTSTGGDSAHAIAGLTGIELPAPGKFSIPDPSEERV